MARTKLKPLPVSKAKTAWGLCAEVIRFIRAEPKRADMGVVIAERPPQYGGPACGTVGCFAGWIYLLRPQLVKQLNKRLDMSGKIALAEEILGGSIQTGRGAIDFRTAGSRNGYVFNGGEGDRCWTTNPGTKSHSNAVIARIQRFMRVNEKALKAHRLDA